MSTSLEALSNEHLQEQATKARFAARILHAHFWHNVANTSGGTHQDWPQRAVSLWLRLEVQAVLFALTNNIDSKRGPLALSCIRQHGEDRYSYVVNAVHQASPS